MIEFLESKGYQLILRRHKIWGVEIDLIFKKNNRNLFVEVKSLGLRSNLENRWPWKQKNKFYKIAKILAENPHYRADFRLAVVDQKQKIEFFNVNEIF